MGSPYSYVAIAMRLGATVHITALDPLPASKNHAAEVRPATLAILLREIDCAHISPYILMAPREIRERRESYGPHIVCNRESER